ncbi:hypothetical protein [Allopusillimonas ginsengisoli]|uniref:hypothetical protein n=1 Tax=Allopusillimonas ginsengisoli TaxID=453575 RepID=UPI0010217024|nr:hypothetical protein [Allopusillimonas ginsengisoli]TEA79817.1 hypothetical protein ERE07_02425 [Allopusillimonas ginsengisoli]
MKANKIDREGETAVALVEAALVEARDIARRVLGRAPDAVVAAVLRELCYQRENQPPPCADATWDHTMH